MRGLVTIAELLPWFTHAAFVAHSCFLLFLLGGSYLAPTFGFSRKHPIVFNCSLFRRSKIAG